MKKFSGITMIIISLSLLTVKALSQTDYHISGKVKKVIGLSGILPSVNTIVKIDNSNKTTKTDSLGNFNIDNLSDGKYLVKIIGDDFKTIDTLITIMNKSIESLNILVISKCEINGQIAELDIKKHKPRLLIFGGISPVIYKGQEKFERKYHVKYYDYGDVVPDTDCAIEYNSRIFKYLDDKYGKTWRKEVRKDIVGLKR
jgi:hypothetical protein